MHNRRYHHWNVESGIFSGIKSNLALNALKPLPLPIICTLKSVDNYEEDHLLFTSFLNLLGEFALQQFIPPSMGVDKLGLVIHDDSAASRKKNSSDISCNGLTGVVISSLPLLPNKP